MTKTQQIREGNLLNLIKNIYEKRRANILNGERPKTFPLRSGTRTPAFITFVWIVLAKVIRQEMEKAYSLDLE